LPKNLREVGHDPEVIACGDRRIVATLELSFRFSVNGSQESPFCDPHYVNLLQLLGPTHRGLAARAPYFHNGGAATLLDAVEFYDQRFNLNLTNQQKQDLVAFLKTL
jgi:hypothetical protein